jgi:hypothetical protein
MKGASGLQINCPFFTAQFVPGLEVSILPVGRGTI